MKRRGNGDGSIFKLSGNRKKPYAVRVTVGWTDKGNQKYKYIGYYAGKTEAKNALREYLLNPQKMKLERQTLASVFTTMLDKSDFSAGTKEQYTSGFKKLAALHNKPIKDITLEEIEEAMEGQAQSAQLRIKKTLHNCYKHAIKYDYASKNLADFINVKKEKAKERIPFTKEEIEKLWKYLNTQRYDDIPIMLLYSGLRISELLELKCENIDLDNNTMSITKSKTAAGIRVVPIHPQIKPLIEKRYKQGHKYLITLNDKKLGYNQYRSSYWYVENHTPHDARHTFVTQISKQSDDTLSIKKIVGHATSDITEHYTHRTIEELQAVMNKLKY